MAILLATCNSLSLQQNPLILKSFTFLAILHLGN
jgi:hypothetical protein